MVCKTWTPEEIEYLKNHANGMTDQELAKNLNSVYGNRRTFSSVRKMRQRLDIQKASGRGVCKVTDINEQAIEDKISKNKIAIAKTENIKVIKYE